MEYNSSSSLVYGWGNMTHGQLGLGGIEEEQIYSARQLTALSGRCIKDIASGVEHTVFLLEDGSVYSCGNNDHGQLGHDKARRRPEQVDALEAQVIKLVACGMSHSVAVNDRGQVFTWGDNRFQQLGRTTSADAVANPPKMVKELQNFNVVQIACGYFHTLALTDDGHLFAWGSNNSGQLGISTTPGSPSCPYTQSIPLVHRVNSLRGLVLSCISAGSQHSAALTVSGALFMWGHNRYGQLGVGDEKDRPSPTLCRTLRSQRVKYVTCGEDHTAVLTQDGGVFSFGAGMYGQLGHGAAKSVTVPQKVFELMGSTVTMLACGRRHTTAYVKASGRLYTFGLGGNGQLGLGEKINRLTPTQVPLLPSPSVSPEHSSSQNGAISIVSVYAGGDQCLILAVQAQKKEQLAPGAVSRDFRTRPLGSQVVVLSRKTVEQYGLTPDLQKPSSECQSQIEKIFGSPSCLNGSFLADEDRHFHCSSSNHGVSIQEAEEVFEMISRLKNEYIKQIILGAIEKNLLPSLIQCSIPDVEALRLFITIPCLHFFSEPQSYVTVISPFSAAILCLTQNANRVLESWWTSLGVNYMLKLISLYKTVFLYILNESPTKIDQMNIERRKGLYFCVEMLKKLHHVNDSSCTRQDGSKIVPYETFYVPELVDLIDVRKDYINWLQRVGCSVPFDADIDVQKLPLSPIGNAHLYCNYPFLFDGQAKTLILQIDAVIQMQLAMYKANQQNLISMFLPTDPVSPVLVLIVSRDNIVNDTIDQLTKQPGVDYKRPLKVMFIGEEALDAGGVKKEFFLLLLREILDPKYGMFEFFTESKMLWFCQETFETSEMYNLIGILCGLAIYNSIIIDISLPLALYKKLLNRPVTLDDLKQLQPSVGRSMQLMLDYDGDNFEEVFGISFEITREVYGSVNVIELIPDGSSISVTKENRQRFVDAYVDYVFNVSIKDQFENFARGFHKVCGGHALILFQPAELQAMVVGNENYDWEELKKNTEYKNGFSATHPTVVMFWDVFHNDLSLEDKKKFLLFLTGSNRIPILGMKAVKISMQPMNVDSNHLPVAHTCFNLLDLPAYDDRETMRRKLLAAIEHTHGFGLV